MAEQADLAVLSAMDEDRYGENLVAFAYAVAQRDVIDITRMEPATEEGRRDIIRTLNRAAGERAIRVKITEI